MQDKNPLKISEMFDEIASYYDYMNNIISFGSHYIIKLFALKQLELRENMMILDACCGTGDFVRILSKSGLRVIGLDFSKEMIKIDFDFAFFVVYVFYVLNTNMYPNQEQQLLSVNLIQLLPV